MFHTLCSRAVLDFLHGNWEQGGERPNAQEAALIMLVRKCPATLEKLSLLDNGYQAA